MPTTVRATPSGKIEKKTKLGNVKPGDTFRFACYTFVEAMAGKDDAGFYFVINTQPKKTGRVSIVSTDGKSVEEKDDDHLVIVHPSRLEIGEAEYE